MRTEVSTLIHEEAFFFRAGSEELFGVVSAPAELAGRPWIILVPGGCYGTSMGRNRLFVRLARNLAMRGFPVLRFDFHGIGESSGVVEPFDLDRPLVDDLQGALEAARQRGMSRFALVGVCFGGRTILSTQFVQWPLSVALVALPWDTRHSSDQLGITDGSIRLRVWFGRASRAIRSLVRGPNRRSQVERLLRRKLSRRTARGGPPDAPDLIGSVLRIVRHRGRVLFLNGTEDGAHTQLSMALNGRLGQITGQSESGVEVKTVSGTVHGFRTTKVQEDALRVLADWLDPTGISSADRTAI